MELLAALLRERRAAIRLTARYAFAFAEGERFILSMSKDGPSLERGFSRDCAVTILTDARTLSEPLQGGFDPEKVLPHQLFVWGGDRDALKALAQTLGGGQSLLGLRSNQARGVQ